AIRGAAIGVGTTMLLHCDHVVAGSDAILSTPFLKLGLIPEAASTLLVPMRMGHSRAFSLLVMGRPLTAAEAGEAGIVNTVAEPDAVEATALKAAREIVAFPRPVAIRRGARRIRGVPRPQEVRLAMSLKGKTLFITGASRGIGLAI